MSTNLVLFFVEHGAGTVFHYDGPYVLQYHFCLNRRQRHGRMGLRVDTLDTPTMLVSNYADGQDAAVELWATRGFGKDTLTSPETNN